MLENALKVLYYTSGIFVTGSLFTLGGYAFGQDDMGNFAIGCATGAIGMGWMLIGEKP